jgi:hypothetical protein
MEFAYDPNIGLKGIFSRAFGAQKRLIVNHVLQNMGITLVANPFAPLCSLSQMDGSLRDTNARFERITTTNKAHFIFLGGSVLEVGTPIQNWRVFIFGHCAIPNLRQLRPDEVFPQHEALDNKI